MLIFAALMLAQVLTPAERALQKALLDEAARVLTLRDDAAKTALAERGVTEIYYYRCLRARANGAHNDSCDRDFDAVRRRAITAEVALMGVKFERGRVEKYLNDVRRAAAKIVLGQDTELGRD